MIIDSKQQQQHIKHFKEYLSYTAPTLTQRQANFPFVESMALVQFSQSNPKKQLPTFFVDRLTQSQVLYSLSWTKQTITSQLFQQLKNVQDEEDTTTMGTSANIQIQTNQNQNYQTQTPFQSQLNQVQVFSLNILNVQNKKHSKTFFNKYPEAISICKGFLFAIAGSQLAITQFHPQQLSSQLTQKGKVYLHKLQKNSQVLSIDHIYMEDQVSQNGKTIRNSGCFIVYFTPGKGYQSKQYLCKNIQGSQFATTGKKLIKKVMDFSIISISSFFKKPETVPKPIAYKTLIANVLGVAFKSKNQFYLIDLTNMRILNNTLTELKGWCLSSQNSEDVIINFRKNKNFNPKFDDCIMITIGQSSNLQIFLYYIKLQKKNLHQIQAGQNSPNTMEQEQGHQNNSMNDDAQIQNTDFSIVQLTNSIAVSFQSCILKHYMLINLACTTLKDYVLTFNGIVYLGYRGSCSQMPHSSYISYDSPYAQNCILTIDQRVWKEYHKDIGLIQLQINHQIQDDQDQQDVPISKTVKQRLLMPNRYQKDFICTVLDKSPNQLCEALKYENLQLSKYHLQKLFLEWGQYYKFSNFILYKDELLFVRKNSIGYVLQIQKHHFQSEFDELIQNKLNVQVHDVGTQEGIIQDQEKQEIQDLKYKNKFQNDGIQDHEYKNYQNYQILNSQDWILFDHFNSQLNEFQQQKKQKKQKRQALNQSFEIKQLCENFVNIFGTFDEINKFKGQNPQILTIKLKFMRNKLLKARIQDMLKFYNHMILKQFSSYAQVKLKEDPQSTFGVERHFMRLLEFYDRVQNSLYLIAQHNVFEQDLICLYIDFYESQHKNNLTGDLQFDIWVILNSLFHGLMPNLQNQNIEHYQKFNHITPQILQQRNDQINSRNNKFIDFMIDLKSTNKVSREFISEILFYLCRDFFDICEQSYITKSKTWLNCCLNLPFDRNVKKLQINQILLNQQWRQILLSLYHDLDANKLCISGTYEESSNIQISIKQVYEIIEEALLQNFSLFSNIKQRENQQIEQNQVKQQECSFNICSMFTSYLFKKIKFQRILNKLGRDNFVVVQKQDNEEPQMTIRANKSIHSLTKKIIQTDMLQMRTDQNIVQSIFAPYYQRVDLNLFMNQNEKQCKVNPKYPSKIYQGSHYSEIPLAQQFNSIMEAHQNCLKQLKFTKNYQKILQLEFAMMRIFSSRLDSCFQFMSQNFLDDLCQKNPNSFGRILVKFNLKQLAYDYLKELMRAKASFKHSYSLIYCPNNQKMDIESQNYQIQQQQLPQKTQDQLLLNLIQQTASLLQVQDITVLKNKLSEDWLQLLDMTFADIRQNKQFYDKIENGDNNRSKSLQKLNKNLFFNYSLQSLQPVVYYLIKRSMNVLDFNQQQNINSERTKTNVKRISKDLNKVIAYFGASEVARIIQSNKEFRQKYKKGNLQLYCKLNFRQSFQDKFEQNSQQKIKSQDYFVKNNENVIRTSA